MFLLPIGHENDTVRRLPWITFGIMAICIVIHAFISLDVNETEKELNKVSRELVSYYFQHPYLELDPEARKLIFGEGDNERIEGMLSLYRQGAHRPGVLSQEEEQEKLDQLSQNFKNLLNDFPYRKWGFIPAKKSLIALLTYMFIHGGFLHLIGNLLFLYLMGPFIEDVWGRPIYLVFYVVMGILSALMYAQHYPDFVGPLIGASGAIAGVMGAFLIRYWNTKINFFYIIGFFFKGTFQAPAWLMLRRKVWLSPYQARRSSSGRRLRSGASIGSSSLNSSIAISLFKLIVRTGTFSALLFPASKAITPPGPAKPAHASPLARVSGGRTNNK